MFLICNYYASCLKFYFLFFSEDLMVFNNIPYKNCFIVLLFCFLPYLSCGEVQKDPKVIPLTTRQPLSEKIYPVAIIGAGAAGTMAAKRGVLNNDEVLLFTGAKQERRRSRGHWVRTVDNIPGLSRYERVILELRNEVLEELAESPLSHNLYIIEDSICTIIRECDCFKITDASGRNYYVQYVVLATGIMDEQPHIQGSIRPILPYANGQTIAYCAVCDGHRSFGKKTVVIGHSKSAANVALLLSKKYQHERLTILTNGQPHIFDQDLIEQFAKKNIHVIESPIQEVLGNEELKQLKGFKFENGEILEAEIGFVALGIRPNNQLAKQLNAQLESNGLVITDHNGESSIPGFFVIGDLRANSSKQIYTAWQHAVDTMQFINKHLQD